MNETLILFKIETWEIQQVHSNETPLKKKTLEYDTDKEASISKI